MSKIKKIVLAYSGGLDTSIIIPWLQEHYSGAQIIAFCGGLGQSDDLEAVRRKALDSGAVKCFVEDLREELIRDYAFKALAAGAVYEDSYLLGTALARPLVAYRQVQIALAEGADALAHGATGKGNDQVRFEVTYGAFAPQLEVIAPWRVWDIRYREQALASFVDATEKDVTGEVRVRLFKGRAEAIGRRSPRSLYREDLATFGEGMAYDHGDAGGFIRLYGLPERVRAITQNGVTPAPEVAK